MACSNTVIWLSHKLRQKKETRKKSFNSIEQLKNCKHLPLCFSLTMFFSEAIKFNRCLTKFFSVRFDFFSYIQSIRVNDVKINPLDRQEIQNNNWIKYNVCACYKHTHTRTHRISKPWNGFQLNSSVSVLLVLVEFPLFGPRYFSFLVFSSLFLQLMFVYIEHVSSPSPSLS